MEAIEAFLEEIGEEKHKFKEVEGFKAKEVTETMAILSNQLSYLEKDLGITPGDEE